MPTPLQRLNRRRQKNQQQQNQQQPPPVVVKRDSKLRMKIRSPVITSENSPTVQSHSPLIDSTQHIIWSSDLHQNPSLNASLSSTNGDANIFLGEWPIFFHSSTFSKSVFYLNLTYFPLIKEGDIICIMINKTRFFHEVTSSPELQSNCVISIQEKVASHLHITLHQKVAVHTCPRRDASLNRIEVTILDGCLPRHEIWSLLHSLHDHFVVVNQQLQIDGCDIQVQNLSKDEEMVYGGLITPSTNVIFCRSNCRMYVIVHITREILGVDNSGYMRSEIVTDFCLKKIQTLWKQGNSHHLLTVLLFMHLDIYHPVEEESVVLTHQCVPYIRVLCKDHQGSLEDLRPEISHFISTIHNDFSLPIPNPFAQSKEDNDICVLTKSEYSSPLTALNVIMRDIKYNKQTASFSVNGSHIIFITPSAPQYYVENTYYFITQDSLHQAAVGVDIVSVAPVSPFKAPRIQFIKSQETHIESGFMPTIYYSIEKDDFIPSLDIKDYRGNVERMQRHLRDFYSQASLLRYSMKNLPEGLPTLPSSIYNTAQPENNLPDILSGDETENICSPTFSIESRDLLPRSPDDNPVKQLPGSLANYSSYDSTYGSMDKYQRDLTGEVLKMRNPALFSPSEYTLTSTTSYADKGREEVVNPQDYSISKNNNDDVLFWNGYAYGNHFSSRFIRSIIRPAILPLHPGDMEIDRRGDYERNTYTFVNAEAKDYINLRLKYNYQFEKNVPQPDSIESVTMHQRRKVRHEISVKGAHVVDITTDVVKGLDLGSKHVDVIIQYPTVDTPLLKYMDFHQSALEWNKLDRNLRIDVANLSVRDLSEMVQYSRMHYVICETSKPPEQMDVFVRYLEKKLQSTYGILSQDVYEPLSCLRRIRENNEFLYVAYDDAYTSPFCFHFDVYWCVASLKSVKQFINDIKRNALKANLQFINYPDELIRSLHQTVSPLLYWHTIPYTCKDSYVLHLISHYFTIINELEGGLIGFTDEKMDDFAQLDPKEKEIRQLRDLQLFERFTIQDVVDVASCLEDTLNALEV